MRYKDIIRKIQGHLIMHYYAIITINLTEGLNNYSVFTIQFRHNVITVRYLELTYVWMSEL